MAIESVNGTQQAQREGSELPGVVLCLRTSDVIQWHLYHYSYGFLKSNVSMQ